MLVVVFSISPIHTQINNLNKLIKSRRSGNPPISEQQTSSPVHIIRQHGSKEADLIGKLPGQPEADFDQFSGYITVDAGAGRALFYYFAESSNDPSTKPLLLWLNGGPGCSSLGYGAMEELGPFRVNADGQTLYYNNYAWNKIANILFVESPAGVGFSYSNSSSNYTTGDKRTAQESYTFLINWLERFPEYKTRRFFIAGESYAGHYVPQLASLILAENKKTNQTIIHLTGIAIGNALIEDTDAYQGMYEYFYTHALISDETHAAISHYCDFKNMSDKCYQYTGKADNEMGNIDIFNIYAPLCDLDTQKPGPHHGSVLNFDPCSDEYVSSYLNRAEVQQALHARNTSWSHCGDVWWTDSPTTILPTLSQLIENRISVWIYSGDTDGRIPVTSTRKSINKMKLPIKSAWRPWYSNKEVGGYVVEYKGMVMATVRGAGHEVPSYQPLRALVMISAFLRGELPPPLRE